MNYFCINSCRSVQFSNQLRRQLEIPLLLSTFSLFGGEMKSAQNDRDAMKEQAEGLQREYDRVCQLLSEHKMPLTEDTKMKGCVTSSADLLNLF
ncbi:hypothetical protein Tcan_02812 [Toxocara canis]|uniref:Bap31/Bap29 cytoplasmic coiled-coil domain-containing protein n=1 Tax=Toxocara canis TaxID=6265 RepID=A0A0B2US06_TOXCA|nr:hypothetical protein Tcan_02812 [Toxocara canis]